VFHSRPKRCCVWKCLATVYKLQLNALPLPRLTSTPALQHPCVPVLNAITHSAATHFGFFTQCAYSHAESKLLINGGYQDDPLQLLRGVDFIVAGAAAALGLQVRSAAAIYRHSNEGDATTKQSVPTAISYNVFRPQRVYNSFHAATALHPGPRPTGVYWLNAASRMDAGFMLDDDASRPVGMDRYDVTRKPTVSTAFVLIITKATPPDPHRRVPCSMPSSTTAFQQFVNQMAAEPPRYCDGEVDIADDPITLAVTQPIATDLCFPKGTSSSDAMRRFLGVCDQARGSSTAGELANCLSVDAANIAIAWHPSQGTILQEVQAIMVPELPPLRAFLRKMSVYGAGEVAAGRREGEIEDASAICKLIVCLPSVHVGGELQLCCDGKQVTLDLSQSPTHIRWCAFRADVEHKHLPVRSGHLITLTYDLIADGLPLSIFNGETDAPVDYSAEAQLAVLPPPSDGTISSCCQVSHDLRDMLNGLIAAPSDCWVGIFCFESYPITARGGVNTKLLRRTDALLWQALADDSWDMKLRPVYRYENGAQDWDPRDPNQLPEADNIDFHENFHISTDFRKFAECYNPIDEDEVYLWEEPEFSPVFANAQGVVWLNHPNPESMVTCGAYDHVEQDGGDEQMEIHGIYATMAIFVRQPRVQERVWNRRMAAVRAHAHWAAS
jgi:hypothetical protein